MPRNEPTNPANAEAKTPLSADDLAQLAAFRAECDKVGIPYDAAGLVRHHRGNAAVAAGAEAFVKVLAAERERDAALAEVERLQTAIDAIKTAHLAAWCQDCQSGAPCPTVDA